MRESSRPLLILITAAVAAGCAATRGPDGPAPEATSDPAALTSAEIRSSGAQTAWDALRLLNGLHLEEDVEGLPIGLQHRGHRSLVGPGTPLIVVDGAIHRDFRRLDWIPAEDVASIRIRSPSEAGAEFGSMAANGVLVLTTRSR